MNKTFLTHYINLHNIDIIQKMLGDINKNSAIAALIIPHAATWCEADIAVDKRNTVVLDKAYIAKYCDTMHITERTFKKAIKELQPTLLRKKDGTKDTYYINPFYACHGDSKHIAEYRQYCVRNKLFIPFDFVNKTCKSIDADAYERDLYVASFDANAQSKFVAQAEQTEKELAEYLERDVLSYSHNCLYTNLSRVCNYSAFVDAKLSTTDVYVLLIMSSLSGYTKNQSSIDANNIVTLSVKKQEEIAAKIGIKDRTLRDSLKKLCELSLLHKCERENGKYIVNPFLLAKGEQSKITSLQYKIETGNFVGKHYFNDCADGDIKNKKEA